MAKPDFQSEARGVLERLTAMGIKARLMEGARCVLASMRLQATSFQSLDGALRIDRVVFATVGRDRIKCLRPHALFHLPMIRILDCRDSTSIEARIRLAWKSRMTELRETRAWLDSIGSEVKVAEEGSVIGFSIEGESRKARAAMIEPLRVILPSGGQLSGVTLQRPEDRCLRIDPAIRSKVELEIAISTRLEELLLLDRRLTDEHRRLALTHPPALERQADRGRPVRLLMVGPRLASQTQCIESLRMRGYVVEVATNEGEGLAAFDSHSPEIVLADTRMGRSEGTSLLLALRKVAGVEEIPVVLVDSSLRQQSKQAARRLGAAGYLVHPIDVQRISKRLGTMVNMPRRRRYTRYNRTLPVRVEGVSQPCLVTSLGRGGMFVATDDNLKNSALKRCQVSLPELGRTLECEAEVLYRRSGMGRESGGVGTRFHSFSDTHESLLIKYLQGVEASTTAPG